MHYMPGTPWSDPIAAELELEVAAGRIKPAFAPGRSDLKARSALLLPGLVAIGIVLVILVLWLNN